MKKLEKIVNSAKKIFSGLLIGALLFTPLKKVEAADWWYKLSSGEPSMQVYVNDQYKGEAEMIEFGHKVKDVNSWPTVAVFYSKGYIRTKQCVDPDIPFGTSFVLGPSYWSDGEYNHFPLLSEFRINGNLGGGDLTIEAKGVNKDLDVEYIINMQEPTAEEMILHVDQTAVCKNDFTIDADKQDSDQGCKIAQFASMYLDDYYRDSDAARYKSLLIIKKNFSDLGGTKFIFDNPLPMAEPWLEATHSDDTGWQGNTPNCRIEIEDIVNECIPQGWIDFDKTPTDDNAGLWINWNNAPMEWKVGDKHNVSYKLIAQDNPYENNSGDEELKPLQNLCYGPFRENQNPALGIFPSEDEIKQDISIISNIALGLRTYGIDNTLNSIPKLCNDVGIDCYAGAWISNNEQINEQAIQDLIQIAEQNYTTLRGLIVGNEVLLSGGLPKAKLIEYLSQVNQATKIPVTTAEDWEILLNNPNLVDELDYLLIHAHAYWKGVVVDDAAEYVIDKYNQLKQAYPTKPVIIGETGWPTAGAAIGQAVPSEENQEKFLTEFLQLAKEHNIKYFLFEAFDESWKADYEGEVGAHWGIHYADRTPKPAINKIPPSQISSLIVHDTPNDNGNSITLEWILNSELDIDHYNVYRADSEIDNVAGLTRIDYTNQDKNNYVDNSVIDGTNYYYAVTAVDKNGNENKSVISFGPVQSIDNIDGDNGNGDDNGGDGDNDNGDGGDGNNGGQPASSGGGGGGGCFIATAAYGTPMAEQVKVLCKFRDKYLITDPFGKVFIDLYYTFSPPIADVIRDNESLKQAVRFGLEPVIYLLERSDLEE